MPQQLSRRIARKIGREQVQRDLKQLNSSKSFLRGSAVAHFMEQPNKRALPKLKKLLEHSESTARIDAIQALSSFVLKGSLNNPVKKHIVLWLQKSLFDSDRFVRKKAADALTEIGGLNNVIDLINKRYKPNLPARFFTSAIDSQEIKVEKVNGGEWKGLGSPPTDFGQKFEFLSDIPNLKKETVLMPKEIAFFEKKFGKPAYTFKGLPVFFVDLNGREIGQYYMGALLIEKNPKKLPLQFRPAVVAHCFGQAFSIRVANALQLQTLHERGQLQEFLKKFPKQKIAFEDIVKGEGFEKFKKYLE